ncbi:MAG: DUF951 domain-containing protein [Firmicutes bacterium]|jgi:hypothetical protein|nr:DUF951 domain-containing protein [Bacillota bacterium]NLL87355.1 DUF951 domain-containing protein [Bacillota bacterium]HKM17108.1 DUF951 domain-containing protein [Limnochordia bacterium]
MYSKGDILRLRKKHPCGSDQWEVLKAGVDMRLKCMTCQRVILIPRVKLEKQVKEVIGPAAGAGSDPEN